MGWVAWPQGLATYYCGFCHTVPARLDLVQADWCGHRWARARSNVLPTPGSCWDPLPSLFPLALSCAQTGHLTPSITTSHLAPCSWNDLSPAETLFHLQAEKTFSSVTLLGSEFSLWGAPITAAWCSLRAPPCLGASSQGPPSAWAGAVSRASCSARVPVPMPHCVWSPRPGNTADVAKQLHFGLSLSPMNVKFDSHSRSLQDSTGLDGLMEGGP